MEGITIEGKTEPTDLERKWADSTPQAAPAANPMAMMLAAVQNGAPVEMLDKLLALQERLEKTEAKKAFDAAMSLFSAEPKQIVKNKNVRFKTRDGDIVDYNHATLDNVCDVISAAMGKHGLSFRWQTEQSGSSIKVTCFVQHSQGHGIQVSLEAGPDSSGKKNPIQQIASTVSYLQRYTLLAASGMATAEQDDDGSGSGDGDQGTVKLDNLAERLEWLDNCRTLDEMAKILLDGHAAAANLKDRISAQRLTDRYLSIVCKWLSVCADGERLRLMFAEAYKVLHPMGDNDAIKTLTKAKDKRKAELAPQKGGQR